MNNFLQRLEYNQIYIIPSLKMPEKVHKEQIRLEM